MGVAEHVKNLPQQPVGPGEFQDGAAGRNGVQEVGDGIQGVTEACAVPRPQINRVPAVHFAGVGQGAAQCVRNRAVNPMVPNPI